MDYDVDPLNIMPKHQGIYDIATWEWHEKHFDIHIIKGIFCQNGAISPMSTGMNNTTTTAPSSNDDDSHASLVEAFGSIQNERSQHNLALQALQSEIMPGVFGLELCLG